MIDYANVYVKLRFDFKISRFHKKEERHAMLKYIMSLRFKYTVNLAVLHEHLKRRNSTPTLCKMVISISVVNASQIYLYTKIVFVLHSMGVK